MSRLLVANFMRLKKDPLFWIEIAFMMGIGLFFPILRYATGKKTSTLHFLEDRFFWCALFIGVVMAVFCSLFIGTEYSDGTMRNKIIVGHKRTSIYLANLFTSMFVSTAMCTAFFLSYFCAGIGLFGFFQMDRRVIALYIVGVWMLGIAFSSLYTLIAMLVEKKAVSAILCILFSFFVLIAGAQLNRTLTEPKTNTVVEMSESGPVYVEKANSKYLDGSKRKGIQFLYDFILCGQAIQYASLDVAHSERLPFYSLSLVVFVTGIGLVFYQRKDLK